LPSVPPSGVPPDGLIGRRHAVPNLLVAAAEALAFPAAGARAPVSSYVRLSLDARPGLPYDIRVRCLVRGNMRL
jgi:hypothetical protein